MYQFINLNSENKNHYNIEKLLNYFDIDIVRQSDFEIIYKNKKNNSTLKEKISNILPYLENWLDKENEKYDNLQDKLKKLEIIEADDLKLYYNKELLKSIQTHLNNNIFYVSNPWKKNKIFITLPKLLCSYFEIKGNDKKIDFLELVDILNEIGHIPLPPYINREDEQLDENEYQTVFAKIPGAVAAPTASLHFTNELLKNIKNKSFLTLHVGAGTFKPVEVENILEHPMHSEFFEIPITTAKILDSDVQITAVGTTATRTIEYYAREKKLFGECDLFLHPQNKPIRVNNLLTNFHLPKSTLIMLVSAFIGREKTLKLYDIAIKEKYRFYSYGDAMLIL